MSSGSLPMRLVSPPPPPLFIPELLIVFVETMNPRSKQVLQRYLNKIDKEDPTAQEDGEFDPR